MVKGLIEIDKNSNRCVTLSIFVHACACSNSMEIKSTFPPRCQQNSEIMKAGMPLSCVRKLYILPSSLELIMIISTVDTKILPHCHRKYARSCVLGSGFWVLGSGFWVLGSGFRVLGSGFWVLGSYVRPSKNYAKIILSIQDSKNLSSKFQDTFCWSETR